MLFVVEDVAWVKANTSTTALGKELRRSRLIAEGAEADVLELLASDAVVGVEQETDSTIHAGSTGAKSKLGGEDVTVLERRKVEASGR